MKDEIMNNQEKMLTYKTSIKEIVEILSHQDMLMQQEKDPSKFLAIMDRKETLNDIFSAIKNSIQVEYQAEDGRVDKNSYSSIEKRLAGLNHYLWAHPGNYHIQGIVLEMGLLLHRASMSIYSLELEESVVTFIEESKPS
jgi:hypothetical protein